MLEHFLHLLSARRLSVLIRYVIAILIVLATTGVRLASPIPGLPYLFFIPALMGIGFALGRGPGFLATTLSMLLAAFFFVEPIWSFTLSRADWLASGVFGVVNLGIVAVCDALATSLLRREAALAELEASRAALSSSEAHWRGLFERLDEGLVIGALVRDAAGRVTDWRYVDVNPAWGRLVGIDHASVVGRTIREVFPGVEEEWVQDFVEVVNTGKPKTFTRRVGSLDRWYEGRAFAMGQDRFAVLFLEVTERVRAEARRNALLEIGDQLRDIATTQEMTAKVSAIVGQVLSVTRVGFGKLDHDGEYVEIGPDWTAPGMASVAGRHLLDDYGDIRDELLEGRTLAIHDVRHDPRSAHDLDRWDAIQVRSMVDVPVQERGRTVALLFVHDAVPRLWDVETLAFLRNVADRLTTSLARLKAEADQHLVNQELSHRMKNMLAMVQAIAQQTLKGVDDQDAVGSFRRRLMALSQAHNVLLQTSWAPASLKEVVSGVLEGTVDPSRIRVTGPVIALGAQATLSFSLVLHELATNATKYGALSVDGGYVTVAWHVEPETKHLVFQWQEHDGPSASAPAHKGFGSQLIRAGLGGTGATTIGYLPSGFRAEMRASLQQVQEA